MKPYTKKIVDEYVAKLSETVLSDANVNSLVLFGSQARGDATASSDIDIAVVTNAPISNYNRGNMQCLTDDISTQVDINLFFTTTDAIQNAKDIFDTNLYIKNEGVVVWHK